MGSSTSISIPPTDLTCPACVDLFTNPVKLKCGHTICEPCLKQRQAASSYYVTCPTCNARNSLRFAQRQNSTKKRLDAYNNKNNSGKPENDEEIVKAIKMNNYTYFKVGKPVRRTQKSYVKSSTIGKKQIFLDNGKKLLCNICRKQNLRYWCEDCFQFVCNKCKHSGCNGIKDNEHNVIPISSAKSHWEKDISTAKKALLAKRKALVKLEEKANSEMAKVLEQENQTVDKIKKSEDKYIASIKAYHKKLKEDFLARNMEQKKHILHVKTLIENYEKQIKENFETLSGYEQNIQKYGDCSKIDSSCSIIQKQTSEIDQSKMKISTQFKAKFVPGSIWDTATGPRISNNATKPPKIERLLRQKEFEKAQGPSITSPDKVDIKITDLNISQVDQTVDNRQVANIVQISVPIHQKLQEEKLKFTPYRLTEIGKAIWCIGHPQIVQINDNEKFEVKEIRNVLHNCRSIANVPNHGIAIAFSNNGGLILTDMNFERESPIAEGSFSDVTEYGGSIYAFNYPKKRVSKYELQLDGRWVEGTSKFEVAHRHGHNWDTLLVTVDLIYVASWKDNRIAWYNHSGEMIGSCAEFSNPRLCCVNAHDSVIVSDWGNNCLKIKTKDSNKWSQENLESSMFPFDAIYREDKLLVIQQYPSCNKLLRYDSNLSHT